MSVTEIKRKILQMLLEAGKPLKREDIAKNLGLSVPTLMGHLLGLIKAGYISTPDKTYYAITSKGKEAISPPKIDQKRAAYLLRAVPVDKAFHFYTGIGQYMGVFANSLTDFHKKIQTINVKSIEFHVPRKDFELWLQSLGDTELATKIGQIRGMSLTGENLRKKVYDTVKLRCDELDSLSRGSPQT